MAVENLSHSISDLLTTISSQNFVRNSEFSEAEESPSNELNGVLEMASILAPDSRERVINSLMGYIRSLDDKSRILEEVQDEDLKKALIQVSDSLKETAALTSSAGFEAVMEKSAYLSTLIDESEGNSQKPNAAFELLTSITEEFYSPLFKSHLYRSAAIFWDAYQNERPDEGAPSAKLLTEVLLDHTNKHLLSRDTPQAQKIHDYFSSFVVPGVLQQFAEVALFAPQIRHFNSVAADGESQHLLFHQIENIKRLVENGSGILGDEPGTGKTLSLALTVLNQHDRRMPGLPGRFMVVGSKTVISNWETELKLFVDMSQVEIVNVNFTNKFSGSSVNTRLQRVETSLQAQSGKYQFVLVNYDLFRNKTFKSMLGTYDFHSTIIDEAHNVKSRFLESIGIDTGMVGTNKKIAQRTTGLYRYILDNPEMAIFLATGTPYVKELVEPLILAHLTNPGLFPIELILSLKDDPEGTYHIMRKIMIRHKKEEIADLPPKETILVPISLNDLSDSQKEEFIAVAKELVLNADSTRARFYSLLALEGIVKYAWLVDKVKSIIAEGKKVVIFTPFVDEDRYTAAIATLRIAQRIYNAGITSVGVLDGSLTEWQKDKVQDRFKRAVGDPIGLDALVGNYMTAGESITLNSRDNHATEVIVFTCPEVIPRFIQATDRIHRLGQEEKVTVYIPFVTDDLLERARGTFDEQIVVRLAKELTMFEAVVDGHFFVESGDIFHNVMHEESYDMGMFGFRANSARGDSQIAKDLQKDRSSGELSRYRRAFARRAQKSFEDSIGPGVAGQVFRDMNVDISKSPKSLRLSGSDKDDLLQYLGEIHIYPIFNRDDSSQEQIVFRFLSEGKSLQALAEDEEFLATISPSDKSKFAVAFADSKTIQDFATNCTLRLVPTVAAQFKGRGMSLLDLIQEGNFALMKAVEEYNYRKGYRFYKKASSVIKREIRKAIAEKVPIIPLPADISKNIARARRLSIQFYAEQGREPDRYELRKIMEDQTRLTSSDIDSALEVLESGVTRVVSLDKPLFEDGSGSLGDFIPDKGQNREIIIELWLEKSLSSLSIGKRRALELKFGFDQKGRERTDEHVGYILGVDKNTARKDYRSALRNLYGLWLKESGLGKRKLPAELDRALDIMDESTPTSLVLQEDVDHREIANLEEKRENDGSKGRFGSIVSMFKRFLGIGK